jgi:hypothetical protein
VGIVFSFGFRHVPTRRTRLPNQVLRTGPRRPLAARSRIVFDISVRSYRAVVALCTDDVRWSDPALVGSPTHGKEAVRDFAAFTFRDGLICRYDTYYDHAEMLRQLTGG